MKTKPLAATRGFLLITLLFLMVLVSLSLLKISERYQQEIEREKEAELIQIGHEFRTAIQQYYFYHNLRRYPHTRAQLLKDDRFPQTVRFLRKDYRDPITGGPLKDIQIGPILVGVYSSSTTKPLKESHFQPDDTDFEQSDQLQYWTFTYPPHLLKILPRNQQQKDKLDKGIHA